MLFSMLMYLLMLTNTVQPYKYFSVSAHKNKIDSFMANNCDIHIVKCRLILCLMINLLFFVNLLIKGKDFFDTFNHVLYNSQAYEEFGSKNLICFYYVLLC